jgi:cellulose synthase/poly-beta-1,6-N-acetylglucosamine synthase-like glycosyltransferase
VGLNDGLAAAKGEIVIVFDADYIPTKNLIKKLALSFNDPQIGSVMGRVIPINPNTNILTNLINLERSGGYQIDQQARFNLGLIPQYGGTVGGFRRKLVLESGGFDTSILAEDTELTYRLYTQGYKVVYDNSAECYEEAPEAWDTRGRQVRRWSRGHNGVMLRYFFKMLTSKHMRFIEKVDGLLLLVIYMIPFLLGLGILDCIALFFLGAMDIFYGWWVFIFIGAYNTWGNFAPFYQITAGALLDGMSKENFFLPMLCFGFYFYTWNISLGFIDAVVDVATKREVSWAKTERYVEEFLGVT